MKKIYLPFLYLLIIFFSFPKRALAVPIPEITNNLSVLLGQIAGIFTIVFVTVAFYFKKIYKNISRKKSYKVIFVCGCLVVITGIVFVSYFYFEQQKQTKALMFHDIDVENSINKDLEISEKDLRNLLEDEANLIIYDARYREEYEAGHLRDAKFWNISLSNENIREVANSLDPNKLVVFYCTDGVRSGFVATKFHKYHKNTKFLKGFALALDEFWAGDAYEYGMEYSKILDYDDVEKYLNAGAKIIDPRRRESFEKDSIDGSINIPIAEISFEESLDLAKNLNNEIGFVVVCKDRLSCFEAYILDYRLEFSSSRYQKDNLSLGIFPELDKLKQYE